MKLLWKLLRQNISKPQLIGFFIANLLGMSIILVAIQFYNDINSVLTKDDKLFSQNYITVSKKVGLLDMLQTKSSGFTPDEIKILESKRFVKEIGVFTPSRFSVYGGLNQAGMNIGTEMFFESLPSKFIDIKSSEWTFSPVDNTIPIILPRNYLDLYNFGFAEARSMPKVSEGALGLINLDIIIGGNGQQEKFKGRIIGFSDRINTILVPESFMEWANKKFASKASSNPTRLMIDVDNIADPQIASYFSEKGYQIEGEKDSTSRIANILKIIITIVIATGAVICALSFAILVLSIYLLLEKNMDKLMKLRHIGYSKSVIVRPYELLIVSVNLIILLLSICVVIICQNYYSGLIGEIWGDFESSGITYTLFIALILSGLTTIVNVIIIRGKVK